MQSAAQSGTVANVVSGQELRFWIAESRKLLRMEVAQPLPGSLF